MEAKNIYIIAGCNGSGKTTVSFTILPEIIHCKEFVNADEIAKGLSPFNPQRVAVEAGIIMLNRINELFANEESFAFETTLSGRSYKKRIIEAQSKGYVITLLFLWLKSVELAKERIRVRVQEGGHDIEINVIERRYVKGICNLFDIYLPIVDGALIVDNSSAKPVLMASKTMDGKLTIIEEQKFNELKQYYDDCKKANRIVR